ncbi:DUF3572 family protein [Paracoccus marinaquae]|uniref:DUF3572 domain-containing protein n=1 Tax=Paracoccus marinaquae TaxID=2841926 RepID=A0ABS6AFD2_9RHOB|nr:DUF3572 family protein [Paracoccus marinaquae]MBU3029312.1 DUF3572 domain-containing protein [Paracoccus marinaquae]
MSFSAAQAQDLAMNAFLHVIRQPELIAGFMAATGLKADDLRQLAARPEAGLQALDFLLEDDARVLEAARAIGCRPQDLLAARVALAGPGSYGWEAG